MGSAHHDRFLKLFYFGMVDLGILSADAVLASTLSLHVHSPVRTKSSWVIQACFLSVWSMNPRVHDGHLWFVLSRFNYDCSALCSLYVTRRYMRMSGGARGFMLT